MQWPVKHLVLEHLVWMYADTETGTFNPHKNDWKVKRFRNIAENLKAERRISNGLVSVVDFPEQKLIEGVFDSLKEKGLVNPLVVFRVRQDRYMVVIGNQRLTALIAMEYKDPIPCIFNNGWNALEKLKSYQEVS